MSKPISFGFASKSKPTSTTSTPNVSKPGTPKPIILSSSTVGARNLSSIGPLKVKKPALRDDSEDEDEAPPRHEELTGFGTAGAILSKPKETERVRVIENPGNSDWRKRGKNLLPSEVQAARNGEQNVVVEKDEVSKVFGLQFAEKRDPLEEQKETNGDTVMKNGHTETQPQKEMTEDERALAALLDDGSDRPRSTATIAVQGNESWQRSETDDFRADVATRPEPSTLEEYAAMPVEEFGMAMLRGMGRKRRANGEIIDLNRGAEEEKKKKERKQEGFLGIGAKPVKGLEGVELGAWGKSDMRKNQRGEGFFTPVMIEDKRTGERITEEEFERRKKTAGKSIGGEEDWRDRRDRNLEKSGRDNDREERNGGSHSDGSRKRDRDDEPGMKSSRRDRDRNDRDYDSSRSRRDRSRSRDRRRRDDDQDEDPRARERRRERHQERYRDNERYESSSSRKSDHRHRDRDRDRVRDRDSKDGRYRDR